MHLPCTCRALVHARTNPATHSRHPVHRQGGNQSTLPNTTKHNSDTHTLTHTHAHTHTHTHTHSHTHTLTHTNQAGSREPPKTTSMKTNNGICLVLIVKRLAKRWSKLQELSGTPLVCFGGLPLSDPFERTSFVCTSARKINFVLEFCGYKYEIRKRGNFIIIYTATFMSIRSVIFPSWDQIL